MVQIDPSSIMMTIVLLTGRPWFSGKQTETSARGSDLRAKQ